MWLTDFLWKLNGWVGDFVWGPIMIGVFLMEGMWFQIKTAFLPVWKWKLWMRKTILAAFFEKEVHESKEKGTLSQFQSVCTADGDYKFCDADILDQAVQKCIPARKAQMLDFNRKAIQLGAEQ